MIKVIIFDVDGVLIDSFEANLKFFQDLMVANNYKPPSREQYRSLFHLHMHDLIKTLTQADAEEVERIWQMGKRRDVRYPTELLKNPDSLEEVMDQLSRKYELGIVTSRLRRSVYESERLIKLKDSFEVVVGFEDTKQHKPNPEPLLLAANIFNIRTEECIYVGDTESDVKAAQAAGMKIVIYSDMQISEADAYTSSFRDLPKIINEL